MIVFIDWHYFATFFIPFPFKLKEKPWYVEELVIVSFFEKDLDQIVNKYSTTWMKLLGGTRIYYSTFAWAWEFHNAWNYLPIQNQSE